jgi:hypothetical protein
MVSSLKVFIRPALLTVTAVLLLTVSVVNGQTTSTSSTQGQVATNVNSTASKAATPNAPVLTDYRGVSIGMAADDVRGKLDKIKKGDSQDYLAFSDQESAQIYYDDKGKVTAISIDYFGGNAPTPEAVLGVGIEPKADGSMYKLNRYPQAGYWVSYNRTAGDKPIVTVTMQKM